MLARKLASFSPLFTKSSSSSANSTLLRHLQSPLFFSSTSSEQAASSSISSGKKRFLGRRVFRIALISVTGGLALSALNDLAMFHGCSSKAIEEASQNQKIIETIGVPIVRGPWYDASLAVGHRRRSVSCTFPVSGPQGSGIFQLKAIRHGGLAATFCQNSTCKEPVLCDREYQVVEIKEENRKKRNVETGEINGRNKKKKYRVRIWKEKFT